MRLKKQMLLDIVRHLVVESYYLPLVPVDALSNVPASAICTTVECVEKRAIEVLTSTSEEMEVYRQLVLMLSLKTAITASVLNYEVALIRARYLQKPFVHEVLAEIGSARSLAKRSATVFADLVQLNFAYMPAETVAYEGLPFAGGKSRVLVSTLQSRALVGRMPLRPFEPSTVDLGEAERIVRFCVALRQRAVEGFLKLRPLRACDIFHYVYQWAKREVERIEHHHLARALDRSVYEELFTTPYYLRHYGIVNFDTIKHELFLTLSA
jgi:hypothetical protein